MRLMAYGSAFRIVFGVEAGREFAILQNAGLI
jgi:hypothetical protein